MCHTRKELSVMQYCVQYWATFCLIRLYQRNGCYIAQTTDYYLCFIGYIYNYLEPHFLAYTVEKFDCNLCQRPHIKESNKRSHIQTVCWRWRPINHFGSLFTCYIANTGGPRLVRFLGLGKNRTMRNSY